MRHKETSQENIIATLVKFCVPLILSGILQQLYNWADAFIVAPGGIGTFDEFFQVITLAELGQKDAPIVLFNVDGYYDDLIGFLDQCTEKGFIRRRARDLLYICNDPAKAVEYIDQLLG